MISVDEFFAQYKSVTYQRKSLVIKPDQILDTIYFVKTGYIKQSAIGPNGDEFILNIYKPGSFFAISIAIHRRESHYTFEAMTDVELIKAPTKEIMQLLRTEPDLAHDLLMRITSGLNALVTRMETIIFGSASQKVASAVWQNAHRFGKKQPDGSVIIQLPLTHQQIASLTGLTRETVSIEMAKLKKQSILNYQGKVITVLSLENLKTLVPIPD
jgi:CRP/FNR family transcriptional regulator